MRQQVFLRLMSKIMVALGVLIVFTIVFVLSNGGSAVYAKASSNRVGVLSSGESLGVNDTVTSPSGAYVLKLQGDGNLVLTKNGGYVWSSLSTGSGGGSFNASMQSDGNFVVYCYKNGCATTRSIFSTCTHGDNYSHLEVQDDGNVVVYTPSHRAVWARTWNHNCH